MTVWRSNKPLISAGSSAPIRSLGMTGWRSNKLLVSHAFGISFLVGGLPFGYAVLGGGEVGWREVLRNEIAGLGGILLA